MTYTGRNAALVAIRRHWVVLVPIVLFVWGQTQLAGYIKDDAYISLRYARNLSHGWGLAFNPGAPPLEGYSNFFWVILEALGQLLGSSGAALARGLSLLAALVALGYCWLLAAAVAQSRRRAVALTATTLLAIHPTFQLWAQGGLAGPLLAAAMLASIYHLVQWQRTGSLRQIGATAIWCIVGCLTRPEGHLLAISIGAYLWLTRRRPHPPDEQPPAVERAPLVIGATAVPLALMLFALLGRSGQAAIVYHALLVAAPAFGLAASILAALWLVGVAVATRAAGSGARPALAVFLVWVGAALLAYHVWRISYFGDLWPNPAYVKTAGGLAFLPEGLRYLGQLFAFATNAAILALAAVGAALAWRKRSSASLLMAFLVGAFLAYLVWVAGDEMPYFRLFLPVLPLACILASTGSWRLAAWVGDSPNLQRLAVGVPVAAFIVVAGSRIWQDRKPFSSTERGLRDGQMAMARYVRARARPDAAVVFQDMGAAPYQAGDLRWIDPIGVVDHFIAHECSRDGVDPFQTSALRRTSDGRLALHEANPRIRDYLFSQRPGWIAGVAYLRRREDQARVARAFDANPRKDTAALEAALMPHLRQNPHYHGLFRDPRFLRGFRLAWTWKRQDNYYIVLFARSGEQRN